MNEFAEDRIKELSQLFNLFDRDKDGFISIEECQNAYLCLGYEFKAEELSYFLEDKNSFNLNLFINFLQKRDKETDMEEELIECFKTFDKDKDGKLNAKELKYLFINIGERFSNEEIEEIISQVDTKGEGAITYKDFVKLMFSK
jgi:Ca2+-binding EF-hand superfamily protein